MLVKFKLDPTSPPVMTAEDLARLDALTDEQIDYSDCPELDDAFFATARRIKTPCLAPQQPKEKQQT